MDIQVSDSGRWFVKLWLLLVLGCFAAIPIAQAQVIPDDLIVFVWNDQLLAQSVTSSELLTTETVFVGYDSLPATSHGNVFAYRDSPLQDVPLDGYGFNQGLWSPDGTMFVFLAVQPDAAGYYVIVVGNDGVQRILFSGKVSPEQGYLVPVGWADDGALMLLERYSLHTLDFIRLWRFADGDSIPVLRHSAATPDLKGNSAALRGGWVFVGFDVVGLSGFLINLNSGQLLRFNTRFALQSPPASVFEIYPVEIVGVIERAEFMAWLGESASIDQPASTALVDPFLYWPLPDDARSITCRPDSEWTDENFVLECPGLATPRAYPGHEGTDVGGKPDGLAPGTYVYAAAPGLVIDRLTSCQSDDITCGDSYGNMLLLEHSRVVDHDIQTWFTGYAHLQTVIAAPYTYIHELGLPVALSGSSGFGGAHLHFEVRSAQHPNRANWLDPWDARLAAGGTSLWLGEANRPTASVLAFPPPTLLNCETVDGNNLRRGPGTQYEIATRTVAGLTYEVFQVQRIETGGTPGDWYHVRWTGALETGWIWSDLMSVCEDLR
jgi:murein DD-endopeptidase MepM/ murein hydrolase activator NlpD